MARYAFLMYDPEDWHDTADEQAVLTELVLRLPPARRAVA